MFNGLEIQFIGNLTRDPELRYLPNGSAVCNLSLAVNSVGNGADGERQERTDYVRGTLWGKSAENANQYLVKGQEIICRGRLRSDPATGSPRLWRRNDGTAGASHEVDIYQIRYGRKPQGAAPAANGHGHGSAAATEADANGFPAFEDIPF